MSNLHKNTSKISIEKVIMAEEDEIDVLGDFSLDNLLSNNESDMFSNNTFSQTSSEILSLNDYTIHPQWLLDKPSANPACWYNSTNNDFGLPFEPSNSSNLEVTESITDESGWTEKEKDLLKRGIEIFGKSHFRLSQFIGSRTAAEVKYFLKNFYTDFECNVKLSEVVISNSERNIDERKIIDYGEILDETEIPASIEEVIAAVSTAKPTVQIKKAFHPRKKVYNTNNFKKKDVQFKEKFVDRVKNLTKNVNINSNTNTSKNMNSKKNTVSTKNVNNTLTFTNNSNVKNKGKYLNLKNLTSSKKLTVTKKTKHVKFKTKLSLPRNTVNKNYFKNAQYERNNIDILSNSKVSNNVSNKNTILNKLTGLNKHTVLKNQVVSNFHDTVLNSQEDTPIKNERKIVTGKGLSVPVSEGEEVIKIKKENSVDSESDLEIDVEDIDDDLKNNAEIAKDNLKLSDNLCTEKDANGVSSGLKFNNETQIIPSLSLKTSSIKKLPDLSNLPENLVEELNCMEFPKFEITLPEDTITDLEKVVIFEFFEGGASKTPARYLKIRNHIISSWISSKPTYITKTSVRSGLKNCGDVNCIGRIHSFLEQIGAINFGCSQTSYIRPLYELIIANTVPTREKQKESDNILQRKFEILNNRPRFKKKYLINGEGGCTYLHGEKGEVINTTVVNKEPQIKKNYMKKPLIRLVYCRSFTDNNPQQFIVNVNLSVLLLMDLHAHMSLSEVMGLVGGIWNPLNKKLMITHYEPCKNIASSSTHCDMCPLTQAKATDLLHSRGLAVLGWFHSHPTFAPEPSQQDIETQLSVQQWIGSEKPCLGLILSPFSSHGALIASPFRCMIVDKKENFEDQFVPYKLKADLSGDFDVKNFFNSAWKIFNSEMISEGNRVDFTKKYFQDQSLTHLEKFITSIKMHLAKCSGINKMTCDTVVQGLSDICSKQYVFKS